MNTWFTSDVHFSHKNIIKYCNRPFTSVEEMDRLLIENWNAVVAPDDHIYQLGDFCFGKIDHIIRIVNRLNGIKHFILGNHDKEIINNQKKLLEGGNRIASIDYYKRIVVEKQTIILFHYGCRVWDKYHHGSWLLYGHSHGKLPPYGKSVDVGVDSKWVTGNAEYRPFSFKEIHRYMQSREIEYADMHGKDEMDL